ncbi:MAG: hypothetical protein ACRDGA_04235 [Bacteroidota bacterium]
MIAKIVQCTGGTLRKYYRHELDTAEGAANAAIAQSLYRQAKRGNVTACIFWLKVRAHWTAETIRHEGEINTRVSATIDETIERELEKLAVSRKDGAAEAATKTQLH